MDTILSASFLTALFASGVRQSIPLIYGSVGDAVSERAGVMGISLEGEMLFGAFFSYLVALRTGSLWIGKRNPDRFAGWHRPYCAGRFLLYRRYFRCSRKRSEAH